MPVGFFRTDTLFPVSPPFPEARVAFAKTRLAFDEPQTGLR